MRLLNAVCLLVVVCLIGACGDLGRALEQQNDYATDFEGGTGEVLLVNASQTPSVVRGVIKTTYSAILPKGKYIHVASSLGRKFYQAPFGFEYLNGGIVESQVGGIVQVREGDKSEYYVWYFSKMNEYVEVDPQGEWINGVKPGLPNVAARPWIEGDLIAKFK